MDMIYLGMISLSVLILVNVLASVQNSGSVIEKQIPLVAQKSALQKDTAGQSYNSSQRSQTKRHVVIVTLESAPFMMKRNNHNENNDTIEWHGYCVDFFNELIKHLPYEITYEIYQVADNKFGSKSRQTVLETSGKGNKQPYYRKLEKWNGLIGDLQQGKAHLALAPLAVMAERELAIDFTVPFYDLVGIQILLKKPEVPQDWFKFLTVLDREVWFSITIAYFVTSFVMFLFDRLSPYSHKNLLRIQRLKNRRKVDKNFGNQSVNSERNNTVNSISSNLRGAGNGFAPNLSNELRRDHKNISSDHLAKSHELFVGSLGVSEPGRRSSAFFLTGFEPILNRRKDSVFPSDGSNTKTNQWQQDRRTSKTLSDYFQGIDLRKNMGGWDGTDADSDIDDGKPDFGLRDSLWFCITSLTPQGGGEAPQNLSGRVVAGAWWLFCFIIIASYTANLAAFLTVSRLDIPIESLDDLAKQYRVKYAPVDGTAEQTYFERMAYIEEIFYNIWKDMSLNDSLSEEERSRFAVWDYPISDKYTKIWAQIQQVGMPTDVDSGIRRVKSSSLEDGFALLADANMVKHAVMTDCSFKAVGDEFSRKPIALGVRKGDDKFRDDLSYAILQLINQRFMEILREKWWTNNPNRVICDNNDESEGISIENIGGVFIIIFAGVVLSFFVWAIERFVYKTKTDVSQNLIQRL